MHLPLSTILPNRFFPLKKFLVEQFHLLYLNWCWHSATAILAPLATAASTPGFSLASRRCFLLNVACTAGSIYSTPGDSGDKLFGSPAFAIPLSNKDFYFSKKSPNNNAIQRRSKKRVTSLCTRAKDWLLSPSQLRQMPARVASKAKSLANLKNKQRTNAT